MHFGVVDHIRASALTTADLRPPSWNRITDSTHAPPFGNGIGEPHCKAAEQLFQFHSSKEITAFDCFLSATVKIQQGNFKKLLNRL
jgi:hypothetical protein